MCLGDFLGGFQQALGKGRVTFFHCLIYDEYMKELYELPFQPYVPLSQLLLLLFIFVYYISTKPIQLANKTKSVSFGLIKRTNRCESTLL